MKQWNGVFQQYRYKAPDGLLIDANGSIWYTDSNGILHLWCAADSLRRHLHGLWNVTHGGVVENASYIAATGRNW